jgi:enoyl-CoA hydratase/carnithine racemase
MTYEQILFDVADGIGTITLNRPDKLNAWTMRMGAEVRHALLRADRDEAVRVMIVTGAGKGYCAGADMNLFDPSVPEVFRGEYSYPLGLQKPVIAAVNGVAAGLGLSYMLYYDMRIASSRARFATIFSRRGLIAEHGTSWILPRLIGMANACDLLFSGRFLTAQEALAIGLVNPVVEPEDLLSTAREVALEMATLCSPRSLRIMKRQLYGDLFTDLGTAMRNADLEMVACFPTADFREGVASFLERRPPRFTGR